MLNPNTRANTVISQSFIASQFQGYNDPFVTSQPTSSLNQFVRSKQTSDSGFIQDGQNQAFGFNNITANHEPTKLQSLSKKTHQQNFVNANMTKPNSQSNNSFQVQQSNQLNNNQYQQQMALNERYISPGIIKTDSPSKINQFVGQNNSNFSLQQNINQSQTQNNQSNQNKSQFSNNEQSYKQQSFNSNSNINNNSQYSTNQQSQQSRSNVQVNQTSSNSRPSTNLKTEASSSKIGQRLKLNVSQQFSNSFTLDCVTQPQRSNILEMKRRQRQYRKSIQNFFV